jgi:uncharacterized repeat protein (TIGR04076 family)
MRQIETICTSCNIDDLNLDDGTSVSRLNDILPSGMCFLAFHSVFPYIQTLASQGWFNWVGHDDHVIVNCPAVRGIAMHVKAPEPADGEVLEVEVMEKNGPCFRGKEPGDRFRFDISERNFSRLVILYKLFPLLFGGAAQGEPDKAYRVGIGDDVKQVRCEVKFTTPHPPSEGAP